MVLNNKTKIENLKKLRFITGLGLIECKDALNMCDWNIEEALELLRKKAAFTKSTLETKKNNLKKGI